MSYFPPPPPAPPPAQNYPASNCSSNTNGFRGRGTGGHRGRGPKARAGAVKQSSFAYHKPVSNTRGYEENYSHYSGPFYHQNPEYSGLPHQSPEAKKAITATSAYKQPQLPQHVQNTPRTIQAYQKPERNGFINQNGETGHHASTYGTVAFGPYPPSTFQQSSSLGPHSGAIVGPPALQGTPGYIGYDEQYDRRHSKVYLQGAQRNPQIGEYRQPYGSNYLNGLPRPHHSPNNTFRNYNGCGQKRGHGEAFGRGKQAQGPPKCHAPPAVPSFGEPLPLPTKPPPPQGEKKPSAKKKRNHNQLGLTPKTEEHESSEEDDEDIQNEETSLAAAASNGTCHSSVLQINYRGQTSILQSASDIAAWIAERRRRFPTKARAAEAAEQKKVCEQARRRVQLAQKERRDKQITEAKGKKRHGAIDEAGQGKAKEAKTSKEGSDEPADATARRKRRVEKLRRQLEKEEKQVAKAESHTKRKRSPSPVNSGEHQLSKFAAKFSDNLACVTASAAPTITAPDLLTSASQPQEPGQASITSKVQAPDSNSDLSVTDSEDLTSSSGSLSSNSSDTPEAKTSKIDEREFVPPKRDKPKQPCKYFMANGRCRSGSSCRFKHELPVRSSRTVKAKEDVSQPVGRKQRVSLYQRLVEQEKKEEEETVLRAIIHLGEQGILDQGVEDGSR